MISDRDRGLLNAWRRKPCKYCKRDLLALAVFISPDGTHSHYWYCTACQKEGHPYGLWIPQKVVQLWIQYGKVRQDSLSHRPLFSLQDCEVCGEPGFPINIARGQAGWPCVNLCSNHYRQWQHMMGETDLYDCEAAITTYAPEVLELETERP